MSDRNAPNYRTITKWAIKKISCKELLKLAQQHNVIIHPTVWVMEHRGDTPSPYRDMYAWLENQRANKVVYICEYMGEGFEYDADNSNHRKESDT